MSLEPFNFLQLNQEQVDKNVYFKAIQNVANNVNTKVYDNPAQNILICSNTDNTFVDDGTQDNILIFGTNCTTDETSGYNIKIGHEGDCVDSTTNISIGHNSDIFNDSNNNIVISHDTDVSTGASNNIIIGTNNDQTGSGNIVIGHNQLVDGGDNIISIGNGNHVFRPRDGSIVLGTGEIPSALPRFQLLGTDLIPLINSGSTGAYVGADPPVIQATNGWMRMTYQSVNIKIPIMFDTDIAIPPPP